MRWSLYIACAMIKAIDDITYVEVLENVMHTINAMETVECRCLVILALTCLPIPHDSGFVSLGGKPVTVLCDFLLACWEIVV